MKNTLFILLFFISTAISATTYYVAPSGSDSNNGSSASPWNTIAYACSKTVAGDVIHINAGTYSLTSQISIPVGVSIEGDGVTTILSSTYSTTDAPTLLLSSGAEGTNGNQSISYIKMDGNNLTAQTAIEIDARSNIIIHDCTIINFASWGVIYNGLTGYGSTSPSTYATGNQFYNNTVTNCAGYGGGYGHGNLAVGGQQGFLCHDNVITQTSRGGAGSHGWCWKYYSEGYNKDIKIYNNTFIKPPFNGDWDFAMEFCMNEQGGIEIYNNTVDGAIDMGARRKGNYSYSFYIHNNIIGKTTRDNVREAGLIFENVVQDCIVEYNYFQNLSHGIGFSVGGSGDNITNLTVRYNIFDQMGNANECWGVYSYPGESVAVNTNVYFYNNVFTALAGNTYGIGIALPPSGKSSYWYIRNNIFVGFTYAWVTAHGDGTMNYLYLQNNIAYSNGNSNNPLWESPYSPTYLTNTNLIMSDPLFVSANSDWHLQAGSPAINAGINVSLATDYAGNTVRNPPDIGAYEYGGSQVAPPAVPVYQSSVVQNATPNVLEMTYSLSLNNLIIPAVSAFSVLVNSTARAVSTVAISGTKVQLTLASAVKFGDVITVSYTKPVTNPLQTTAGGTAVNISAQSTTNNLINSPKDIGSVTFTMTISPNHVHRILNVLIAYSSTPTTALSPEVITISDLSGYLFVKKSLTTGATNLRIPLNLASGIYNVVMTANNVQMASQKITIY